MALETRLGSSGVTNGNHGDDASQQPQVLPLHHHPGGHPNHLSHLHMKAEPMNSSYFPTDASILTMGPAPPSLSAAADASAVTALATATAAAPALTADLQWKICNEEKERYYAECRALKHELAHAMVARRIEKRHLDAYTGRLQDVVDTFQREMQSLLSTRSSSAAAQASSSSSSPSSAASNAAVLDRNHDDLVALRQKLLEVNHALARQQTELLELKERENRHALPESQRVKWQVVMLIKKSMQEVDFQQAVVKREPSPAQTATAASSLSANAAAAAASLTTKDATKTRVFEERLEGVRPSVFELLFHQDMKVMAMATAPSIGLDLDAKACTQVRDACNMCSSLLE